jgi:hypothetical protein
MNNKMMPELQVQKTTKNKEKREWKKKIREQKQESNLFRSETTMNKTSSALLSSSSIEIDLFVN